MKLDTTIPTKLAIKFAFSTGIDVEYLFAEAMEAYWRAEIDPSYDPRKSAFVTFATTCVTRQLCSVVYEYKKKNPIFYEIDPQMEEMKEPNPFRVAFFLELMSQLPSDAKVVAQIALSDATDGIPFYRIRSAIRNMLRPNWSHGRIDRAFQSLTVMLKEAESLG